MPCALLLGGTGADAFSRRHSALRATRSSVNSCATCRRVNGVAVHPNDIEPRSSVPASAATSVIVGVATGSAWSMAAPAAVWGLFAGVMNVVPYFGALLVSAVLAAVGLLQFGTVGGAVLVGGMALTITSLEGMVLTPLLLSRAGALNHVAIFTAIAFWSWAWGAAGMLLAVPMLMVVKAVCDHVDGLQAGRTGARATSPGQSIRGAEQA